MLAVKLLGGFTQTFHHFDLIPHAAALWPALQEEDPDLILLDAASSEPDGMLVLEQLRSSSLPHDLPVIMASGGAEYEIVRCLDSGADDCLAKPFGMMEMVSRVRAVLRRKASQTASGNVTMGGISLSLTERIVKVDGKRVDLTYKEFEILRLLLENPGEVFSRERLYVEVWGKEYNGADRTVTMHIRALRKKLGNYGSLIESIRYVGYRMKRVP